MDLSETYLPDAVVTQRLTLRRFRPGDGDWYYAAGQRNRTHLAEFESDNVILEAKTPADAEQVVCDLTNLWEKRTSFFLAGFDRDTHDFVLQVFIGPLNAAVPEYQIGYFVDQDQQGKGYVTEAVQATLEFIFEELGAHRVSLECDGTNERSWRVAERCGMTREGHCRENKKNADGTFSGAFHYGLLRRDFRP